MRAERKAEFGVLRVGRAWWIAGFLLVGVWSAGVRAQVAGSGPVEGQDRVLLAAETLVGKALFVRGFYVAKELDYDAGGRVQGSPKTGDWTLAAVNVLKVLRRGADELELDGVRVAIRYDAGAHEFQRHPLNDEKVRIVLGDSGTVAGLEKALAAVFSVGIDPALQRAMPDYWQHYFNPGLAWPQDGVSGQTVYMLYGGSQAKDVTAPVAQHRTEAKYTEFAQRDKVQGPLRLSVVVDAGGVPRRIAVAMPLGYGLDASAVEAMRGWRFSPGTKDGAPVATGAIVEQQFALVPRQ